jgi:hypothetical protein
MLCYRSFSSCVGNLCIDVIFLSQLQSVRFEAEGPLLTTFLSFVVLSRFRLLTATSVVLQSALWGLL